MWYANWQRYLTLHPPLIDGGPYSEEHGSLEDKLIFYASYVHSLFNQNAADLFQRLDRAVRENQEFAVTIAVHARKKYGCGATFTFLLQHSVKDVWETIIQESKYFMKFHKWSGTTNVKLIQHTVKHSKLYIDLTEASTHVPVECPNEHSRVTYLMTLITCKDTDFLATLSNVCQDEDNKRRNF